MNFSLYTVVALLLTSYTYAEARPAGGVTLQIDTQIDRAESNSPIDDGGGTQKVGLAIDAYGGGSYGGAAVFIDAHFGAGYGGGFAYQFDFHPLGVALYDKNGAISLALTGGVRLHGVTGYQDFGVFLPVRLSLNMKLGSYLHVNTWASVDTSLRSARDNGSEHTPFGDEMRTGLAIRFGPNRTETMGRGRVYSGNGYFIGATYSERFDTRFWGLLIGHGMDMGGSAR